MSAPLLKCIGRAVVRNAGQFLLHFIPGGRALYEIAMDAWDYYQEERDEQRIRAELAELASASADDVKEQVEAVVQTEAASQPENVQRALAAYLAQVPAMIRRSLRRPSDPAGTTVPMDMRLDAAEDLLPFLPPHPPRFKAGDCPLPGVDWVLEELLGVGGFGEVWKARHRDLKSKAPVALKFCLDESAAKTLRNEAGLLDRLMQHGAHSGIVPLQMAYLNVTPPCLEYEFVEGGDLTGLIQQRSESEALTAAEASNLLLQLAEIIRFAHQAEPPIVHCDLKPANILLNRTGDGEVQLRITDFGIGGLASEFVLGAYSRVTSRQDMLTEAVRGAYTPLYASPQQIRRRRGEPANPRDDVHALGVIWYQLVTGDLDMLSIPPDWQDDVRQMGLPDEQIQLLAQCISPKENKRPADAGELAHRLSALLSEQAPIGAVATSPPPKPEEIPPKKRAAVKSTPGADRLRPFAEKAKSQKVTTILTDIEKDREERQELERLTWQMREQLLDEPKNIALRQHYLTNRTSEMLHRDRTSKSAARTFLKTIFFLTLLGMICGHWFGVRDVSLANRSKGSSAARRFIEPAIQLSLPLTFTCAVFAIPVAVWRSRYARSNKTRTLIRIVLQITILGASFGIALFVAPYVLGIGGSSSHFHERYGVDLSIGLFVGAVFGLLVAVPLALRQRRRARNWAEFGPLPGDAPLSDVEIRRRYLGE